MTTATLSRAGFVVAWMALGACITLPPSVRDRLPVPSDDDGRGGMGGAYGGQGGSGGSVSLPPCDNGGAAACSEVIGLAAGDWHTCALVEDGHVWCWGSNLFGELGDPSLAPLSHYPPQRVVGLDHVDDIVAANNTTCARVDGDAFCWGDNAMGQLGTGNRSPVLGPQRVALPPSARVTELEAGEDTVCAIVDHDEVFCWGRELNGQPWWGTESDPTPYPVLGFEDMGRLGFLAVGTHVGCAVSEDRADVRCWGGTDDYVSVGDGNVGNSLRLAKPVASALSTPVDTISIRAYACTTAGKQLQCWGDLRSHGGEIYTVPTTIPDVNGLATTQQQGWNHTCFLRPMTDTVACRGFAVHGELGPEGVPNSAFFHAPVPVIGGVAQLAVGWQHNCVIMKDDEKDMGAVRCWGNNEKGQCNTHPDTNYLEPEKVTFSL